MQKVPERAVGYEPFKEGDLAFLIFVHNTNNGFKQYRISSEPGRTNMRGIPLVRGWLGETNNVSKTALGIVRVKKLVSREHYSDAYEIEPVEDEDMALASLGWRRNPTIEGGLMEREV